MTECDNIFLYTTQREICMHKNVSFLSWDPKLQLKPISFEKSIPMIFMWDPPFTPPRAGGGGGGGRVLLYLGKSSIDGLVICFVIISGHLVFVWLFLVSVLTYRAASGALAVLSSSEKVCNQIIKVLLSNILYPSSKGLSTAKRAREFSTPLYYYAWHRATRSHEARGSGDENGFYAASAGAQNSARDRVLISFLRKPNVRNKTVTDLYLKRNRKRNCNSNKHTMNVQ